MNNEPVAWIDAKTGKPKMKGWVITDHDIPLYTHPVKDNPHPKCDEACMYLCQMRELTDEEITQVFDECYPNNADGDVVTLVDFARAILRKASEK